MKKRIHKVILFIFCVLLIPLKSQESEKTNLFGEWFELKIRPTIKPKIINNDIISAMIKVESAGNDSAYNLKEDAVGCLQIRPIMVREVNRILKRCGEDKRFDVKDR